jgi:hypothetical protein
VTYAVGGNGCNDTSPSTGSSGATNTGNGGGGGSGTSGSGGSGIVILRYADSLPDFTTIDAGLTYTKTTSGGYKIYKFTAGTGTVTV